MEKRPDTASLDPLSHADLERASGGGDVNAPLSGDVQQQINTNWGGTQIVNPPAAKKPTTRTEYLRQNPEARFGPPPYKPKPVR
ncbi:MAG TPA: hypothetical protein VNO33_18040 [Kofleriaceae bacterium]|nr:hypothetical protein [Kofleriaceae bacterium]